MYFSNAVKNRCGRARGCTCVVKEKSANERTGLNVSLCKKLQLQFKINRFLVEKSV